MKRATHRFLLAAAGLIAVTIACAEPAVTIKQVDLKAAPASDAATVATLPAESGVDLVARQGAWVQLDSGKSMGWAKLFDIRLAGASAAPAPKSGMNSLAETLNLAAGNRGASVTTGVRGLDADTLSRATPNPQEFGKLTSYTATKEEATAFAAEGKLEPRNVEFFK